MNTYNIYDKNEPATILYHAVAEDAMHIAVLAGEAGIDIAGLEIDCIRKNVKNEMGKPCKSYIEDALIH